MPALKQSAVEFRNEPTTDFTNPANATAMKSALAAVRAQFGREYELRIAGERRTVSLLFADLRGSTTLAEQLAPEDVIAIVNAYVGELAHSVFAHDGMLDKFLGDGLMAIFGVLPDPSCGAVPAARAAHCRRPAISWRLNR